MREVTAEDFKKAFFRLSLRSNTNRTSPRLLCEELERLLSCSKKDAQLLIQRATDKGIVILNEDWTMRLGDQYEQNNSI